jgi:integrase
MIKKVPKKRGGYSWKVDYYDPSGKRVERRFQKLAEAQAFDAMVRVSKKEGKYGALFPKSEPPYLFADLARDYLAAYQGQRSFKDKRQIVQDVYLVAFAELPLAKINYRLMELHRSERQQTPTWRRQPRSPSRVNRELSVLRHMLNKAVQWEKLEVSPFAKGESLFLKENNERIRYLTTEEAETLLGACPPHLKPIVETALNTGMRKGEILSLKWRQVRDGWIYLEETKSGRGRPVPLNAAQVEVFRELRAQVQLKSPYVFGDAQGQPFGNVQKSFDTACWRAGIVDFRFHDLRHTCASWLVMAGADLVAVQKQLGHSSIKTTMRYAHLAPGHMKAAINLIGTRKVEYIGESETPRASWRSPKTF